MEDNNKLNRKQRMMQWLAGQKTECELCGEDVVSCLEFHHLTGDKEGTFADLIVHGWGKKRLLEEIRKCICVCANCHKKVHEGLIIFDGWPAPYLCITPAERYVVNPEGL